MKRSLIFLIFFFLTAACDKGNELLEPREDINTEVIAFTNVDLDANREFVRTQETPIGNMLSDAMFQHLSSNGYSLDFSLVNGGNIRFNSATNPDGIYSQGDITRQDASDIFPFDNTIVLVTVTGEELLQIFERGAALWPEPFGGFLQVSRQIEVIIDPAQESQVIDETSEPPVIVSPGNRIVGLFVNGDEVDLEANYTFSFNSFGADGGDGFVTMENLPDENKMDTGLFEDEALADYLRSVSVVAPTLESRIVIFNSN